MTEEELKEFYKQLEWHDWTYEYSDDHSVWQRGCEMERKLMNDARKDKRAEALFEAYRNYIWKVDCEKPDAP